MMKKLLFSMLFIAIIFSMASCSSNPQVKVEYASDGRVQNVDNPERMKTTVGDSVLIRHYNSHRIVYSSHELYGFYRGKIPEGIYDTLGAMYYTKAVVIGSGE